MKLNNKRYCLAAHYHTLNANLLARQINSHMSKAGRKRSRHEGIYSILEKSLLKAATYQKIYPFECENLKKWEILFRRLSHDPNLYRARKKEGKRGKKFFIWQQDED